VAKGILDEWPEVLSQFVKVMPTDYKRVLAERRRHDEEIEADIRDADQTGSFEPREKKHG
jgi:glutamate synthase domain-containing protein 3